MLFNSPQFIFGFLPLVLAGFFLFGHFGWRRLAILWLGLASLVFYSVDNTVLLLPLILLSTLFNFVIAQALTADWNRRWLWLGVGGDLLLLGVFKYSGLLLETVADLTSLPVPHPNIPLPIGISFYTFTQIAFLVDVYRGAAREYEPLNYGLFVTYFPHLIAGPILHHREILPQFDDAEIYRPRLDCLAKGLAWFAIGLFKKVMLADSIAPFVDSAFASAAKGVAVDSANAWVGTLSYTLQIYFDFSGYSDMAIGLALLMGITFPLNFNSPYQALSLIEYWRRWHMTLSRFLRDYLYFSLGGNRRGPARRYVNLFATMVLGGLWHGASWNFALWGALHGLGLALNHLWRNTAARKGVILPSAACWVWTLGFVTLAWVPFRADSFATTVIIWNGLFGLNDASPGAVPPLALVWIAVLGAIALFAPNSQEILSHPWTAQRSRLRFVPRPAWALMLGCLFGLAVAGTFGRPSVFLYFRF